MKHSTLNQRQKSVLNYVLNSGKSQVGDLARVFEVSEQTIRNDLDKLYSLKLLQRIHGGAVPTQSPIFSSPLSRNESLLSEGNHNLSYSTRKELNSDEKISIARKAADLIPHNSSLFINIGTTTEKVADALKTKIGLIVVTNNLNIANTLRNCEVNQIMIASGIVRPEDGGIVGAATIEFIEQFRMDFAVIGISGIDESGVLLDYDYREVQVTKCVIKNARSVILVSDHTKFKRKAPVVLGDLKKVDYLVTNSIPNESVVKKCEENEVKLIIADVNAKSKLVN